MLSRSVAALQKAGAGSVLAAGARASGDREMEVSALFSAGVGHRGRSAAARDSGGGARLGGQLDGDVLSGNFAGVPAAVGIVLRTILERATRRLPGHRH